MMNHFFRPAKPAPFFWNYSKTILQTCLFWFVFLFFIPYLLIKIHHYYEINFFIPLKTISILLFSVGSSFGLSAGYTMAKLGEGTPLPVDAPRKLVIKGPYKFLRNPMALGGILQGVAVGLYLGSWLVVLYAFLGAPVWHTFVRPIEEEDMLARFGGEFEKYRDNVPLWVPKFKVN